MANQTTNQQTAIVLNKQSLRTLLAEDRVTQTLQRVGTRWMSADQIKTQAMIAVARNPKLLNCTRFSFLESVVRAAELGLRFAGAGGEAYLIPYGNKCTLIIGYRGLLALARRTGKVTRIEARVVYERDYFKVDFGSGQKLTHRPCLEVNRGDITCAYALAQLRDGSIQLETMTRSEIDGIRKRSPAAKDGPWATDYPAMCRKTVLRRLCKYLPFATAYDDAMAAEEPPVTEEQSRKQVETTEIPEDVDFETGEIRDDNIQPDAVPEGDQASVPQTTSQTDADSLDERKVKIIDEICNALGQLYPGDAPERQAARLKALKHIFGQTVVEEIAKLPSQILKTGLEYLKGRAVGAETGTDDIPF